MMTFRAFTRSLVYESPNVPKEKDTSSIHCLECYGRNIYIGTRGSVVQHLTLPSSSRLEADLDGTTREGRRRKLGSGGPVSQLRAVPVLNHLLVLWDRSLSAFNMFSLDPAPSLKRIQHVSLFQVCESSLSTQSQDVSVELVTASSRKRGIRIHVLGVDRWECVKEVALLQDPVALAVEDTVVCVATGNRYLLHDYKTGNGVDLFPHNLNKQNVIVSTAGRGEFLLNGPDCLGMFVMSTGVCQRPPLQWPEGVLAAGVCFPYVLTLLPQALHVYSLVDQQLKETVCLLGAKGLLPTKDGVYVFTEREVIFLSMVPLEEQIQTLAGCERVQEALALLGGVQHQLLQDSYQELEKTITCMVGFVHFHLGAFTEAKDLFIKGELDPREVVSLYPDLEPVCGAFRSHLTPPSHARDLKALRQEDRATFQLYQCFLAEFLSAVRGTEQGRRSGAEVDWALLRLYAEQGDAEQLHLLVSSSEAWDLDASVAVLQHHQRYFSLGLLYQSHKDHMNAIETWVRIADGHYEDTSCSDVYEHIVQTLSLLPYSDVVWAFADWTLLRDQEVGVRIFTRRDPEETHLSVQEEVLVCLKKYPQALVCYLEFLVHDLKREEEKLHSLLAVAYVAQIQPVLHRREESDSGVREAREKLQQLLWQSSHYDNAAVRARLQPTTLLLEKAIVVGRGGDHQQALEMLVHQGGELQDAWAYCQRAGRGQTRELKQSLSLGLLQIYLGSSGFTSAAVDLLNANAAAFDLETVLQVLPESWSLQLVSQFLLGSLRGTSHQRRMGGVQRGLAQAELLRHKYTWAQASKGMLRVPKGCVCTACKKDLTDSEFVCSLSGELTHTTCSSCTKS
ncbi:transforming growth factor-beta receptor-associated protein 1 [Osmerus mordax]|uniref:transforming growth factor-beta receptor-associated protein 1 n=1 Tax=Osmerus mordax TaxID=8014 RepID=UPI00350FAD96